MRRSTVLAPLLALLFASPSLAAYSLRYSETVRGGLAIAGNTLGLSKELDLNGPGTRDSIGTFIAADSGSIDATPANPSNPWPSGTTNSWQANGSSAALDLPAGSTVLYAELIWGGSYNYFPEDVTSSLDDAVSLSFDDSDSTSPSPDQDTRYTLAQMSDGGFPVNFYVRSAEVTSFVSTHGAGTYAVGGVPGTQGELMNSLNAAGWTLVVAYGDDEAASSHLAIVLGADWVEEVSSATIDFDGFTVPATEPVTGRLVLSAIEGDTSIIGDQVSFEGTASAGPVTLSGPNNPANNFFASQLNDIDGGLDTRGSFGSANHDASTNTNSAGARQGWDLTAVALSSEDDHLEAGTESASVVASSSGDSYVLALVALEIEAVPEPSQRASLLAAAGTLLLLRRGRASARAGSACAGGLR